MKWYDVMSKIHKTRSRPVWGAWIEIRKQRLCALIFPGRAPYGARGLKLTPGNRLVARVMVAPRMGRVD